MTELTIRAGADFGVAIAEAHRAAEFTQVDLAERAGPSVLLCGCAN